MSRWQFHPIALWDVLCGHDATGIPSATGKARSLRSVIMRPPLPEFLVVPLRQYGGGCASPVVKPGQHLRKGEILALPVDRQQVPLHAPSSGRVRAITQHPVAAGSRATSPCVIIDCDGNEEWTGLTPYPHWQEQSPATLLDAITAAGILGLGGAGYPLAAKLRRLAGTTANLLVVNAMECEPYISCDQALIRAHADQLLTGLAILRHITGATQAVIAIGRDKADAITALRARLPLPGVRLRLLEPYYGNGNERVLLHRLTGIDLPARRHPVDAGVLVVNAGTLMSVFRAITTGEPQLSRITTLCGDTLATPKNFEVLTGTPVASLLEWCGVDYARLRRLIWGGPVMGFALDDLSVPVDRTANCLIAASTDELAPPASPQPCINCGACATACPVLLQPQLLLEQLQAGQPELAQRMGLAECLECGACAWQCPSRIPLLESLRDGRRTAAEQARGLRLGRHRQKRHEYHQYRLSQQRKDRRATAPPPISAAPTFDRLAAREEIAAAVARVQSRRNNLIASSKAAKDGEAE